MINWFNKFREHQRLFWLIISLIFAIYYGFLAVQKTFNHQYIIQDDARQYLFWMANFNDPELFKNDLIADYFQSVTPQGYRCLYYLMSRLGIDPISLHKFLPLILGIITTGYCFSVTLQFFPLPLAGFLSSILLNQSIWRQDDLVSATPRAFIYPLFLAFLYYLIKQSLLPLIMVIILQGLFYPQGVLIEGGILLLQFIPFKNKSLKNFWTDYKLPLLGLIATTSIVAYYGLNGSSFSPVITVEQAKLLPEFLPGGRSAFFSENPIYFWLFAERSGMIPALLPPLMWLGLGLPLIKNYRIKVKNLAIIQQGFFASVGMFLLAHLFLFKLHLPSRYTDHTFRIMMALLSGITLTMIFNHSINLFKKQARSVVNISQNAEVLLISKKKRYFKLILPAFLGIILLFYPVFDQNFPLTNYRIGEQKELYQFLQQQPKDIRIASLSSEMNNIPIFAQRSVLVAPEYAIPYHWGYYRQFRQRMIDLLEAQYSSDLTKLTAITKQYNLDFLLIEKNAFTGEYFTKNNWLKQFPPSQEIITKLNQGFTPALVAKIPQCSLVEYNNLMVMKTGCLLNEF